ncbi:MAG: lasso peptide biosynthesis B2 protein [Acidobacteria bacterium]|nr:lasso peptide biosynthesis B2 protein [Acidobacteriota bacterium]
MTGLVLSAYAELLRFDRFISHGDFVGLHQKVRGTHVQPRREFAPSCDELCRAVDIACIWYWKRVLCLHRSSVVTCLLRRHGTNAELVIASRRLPFQAHAWVEVDGRVVNDRPDVREAYSVLERC